MNHLERLEEFEQVLADYQVSDAAQTVLNETPLVLCSAATATGRNTIIRELVKTGRYYFIVSDTTRQPRVNDGVPEQDGVEYWFRSEDQMLDQLRNGEMVEAEIIHHQQISGMSVREIEKAHKMGRVAITDADRGGIRAVKKVKPDTLCLFFLSPSFEEGLRRLEGRGNMSEQEKHRRLTTAVLELEEALSQDYYRFVVNDSLEQAVADVDAIVQYPENVDQAKQAEARGIAEDILIKTRKTLKIS